MTRTSIAHSSGTEDLLQTAQRRFLAGLAASSQRARFLLKGGLRLRLEGPSWARQTSDVDLQDCLPGVPEDYPHFVQEVLARASDGRFRFSDADLCVDPVTESNRTAAVRICIPAYSGKRSAVLQVDVALDGASTPGPVPIRLNGEGYGRGRHVLGCSIESVVADKLRIAIQKGTENDRLKDLYDLYCIARSRALQGPKLRAAIIASFAKRGVGFPVEPVLFSPRYSQSRKLSHRWAEFLTTQRRRPSIPDIATVAETLASFLAPAYAACRTGDAFPLVWSSFQARWHRDLTPTAGEVVAADASTFSR